MKIDTQQEAAMRKVFRAVIAEENEWFESAVNEIADLGEAFYGNTLQLAVHVGMQTLETVYEGKQPTDEVLASMGADFAAEAEWVDFQEPELATRYLKALDLQEGFEAFSAEEITLIPWLIGGWLIGGYTPENQEWEDFLDSILNHLLTLPEPTEA